MRDTVYFVSDLHLGVDPPGCIPRRLDSLLGLFRDWEATASHVFLVGDVFEFWWESRNFVPKMVLPLARGLAGLVDAGVEVHYLGGNHDFFQGTFFEKELGLRIHPREVLVELQGKKVLLHHGDGLAQKDWKYRWARALIDSSMCRFLYGLLPLEWAYGLAMRVGDTSRKAGMDCVVPLDEYAVAARRLLQERGADIFVQGHNHHAGVHPYPEGVHVNCGMWLFSRSYVEMRGGQVRLVELDKPAVQ